MKRSSAAEHLDVSLVTEQQEHLVGVVLAVAERSVLGTRLLPLVAVTRSHHTCCICRCCQAVGGNVVGQTVGRRLPATGVD